jgi:hypothetical protein
LQVHSPRPPANLSPSVVFDPATTMFWRGRHFWTIHVLVLFQGLHDYNLA